MLPIYWSGLSGYQLCSVCVSMSVSSVRYAGTVSQEGEENGGWFIPSDFVAAPGWDYWGWSPAANGGVQTFMKPYILQGPRLSQGENLSHVEGKVVWMPFT